MVKRKGRESIDEISGRGFNLKIVEDRLPTVELAPSGGEQPASSLDSTVYSDTNCMSVTCYARLVMYDDLRRFRSVSCNDGAEGEIACAL